MEFKRQSKRRLSWRQEKRPGAFASGLFHRVRRHGAAGVVASGRIADRRGRADQHQDVHAIADAVHAINQPAAASSRLLCDTSCTSTPLTMFGGCSPNGSG